MARNAQTEEDLSAKPSDGRVLRSARSRERLIAALIELVEAGHLLPTGQEVADRAGMNLRSVFRHFEDMESLYRAIHEELLRTLRPTLLEEVATGSLAERIAAFARMRTRTYERIAPIQRSERLQRWTSPQLEKTHAEFVRDLHADLLERLPEVGDLPTPLREVADLLTSFEAWDRLRTDQNLGPRQARTALEATLVQLLSPEAKP